MLVERAPRQVQVQGGGASSQEDVVGVLIQNAVPILNQRGNVLERPTATRQAAAMV